MKLRRSAGLSLAVVLVALALQIGTGSAAADPDALWKIVHGQCVPDEIAHGNPAPCVRVEIGHGVKRGHVVLKDRKGDTQFLILPTARITGIEGRALLRPDAPNYWAAAWAARSLVSERAGKSLPRDAIGLAVNSVNGRSQNQLHIHLDCVRRKPPPWAALPDALR